MADQAGYGNGQGAASRPDPGLPGGAAGAPAGGDLSGFAKGGEWDACPSSASLALALEEASGPEWRCPGVSRDEMFGLLRQWQALESRAVAGKLGVLRALIRDDDQPLPGGGYHGDLPEGWTKSLTHEVALALAMPAVSADRLMWLAWDLEARLPGTGALLADGTLTYSKAKAVDEALQQLSGQDAAAAEAMILPDLPGKTFGQTVRLAAQAAVTVDPESAARRREDAERTKSRVTIFREESGAAALSGRDMPTGQTLAAHASVCARAQEYQESGAFPDGTRMDQYRVAAYLDLLNGITTTARIAIGLLPGECTDTGGAKGNDDMSSAGAGDLEDREFPPDDDQPGDDMPGDKGPGGPGQGGPAASGSEPDGHADPELDHGSDGRDCFCRECDGSCFSPDENDFPEDNEPHDDDPDDGVPGDEGPRGPSHSSPSEGGPGHGRDGGSGHGTPGAAGASAGAGGAGSGGGQPDRGPAPDVDHAPEHNGSPGGNPAGGQQGTHSSPAMAATTPPRLADLLLPLATLLGLAERPGEGHDLGPLDPALCRELAIAAAGSPHSCLCVTVVDSDGIAIGHGCARTARQGRPPAGTVYASPEHAHTHVVLPARVNLTITATRLAELAAATGPPGGASWAFTADTNPGPPGGYGTWTLTLPDGRNPSVELRPVPTYDCDHRYQSHAYQPNETLRHLVQIRDGDCTFPTCSKHARESDFEHAIPYDKGGRTCACNAGARSRACHQVKQSLGWHVTQPKPGWHQWETPSGRTYIQGPKRYPA